MVTVHTLGGRTMLEAAARAAGPDLGVVGVTMLTSLDGAAYGEAVGRGHVDPEAEVERLTGTARLAGLRGVVCSPHEVAVVRRLIGPAGWIVVPGIRRPEDSTGDQVRIATPAQAAAAGATHLVIGRPLLQAKDPAVAFREMSEAAS
jgi:orotidine-5'-phosphate decarboxylase